MEIKLENVSFKIHNTYLIKDITFTARQGEILGLIGPSGAGKTTIINCINGLNKFSSGTCTIGGNKISKSLLYKVGCMPQEDALYLDLTGQENINFFGSLYKIDSDELKSRSEDLLKFINLNAEKHKLVSEYSGGMKKRLSLVIALLNQPEILLLDEPTVGIDPLLKQDVWKYLVALKDSGKTLIISTHVMDEAIKCDECALISHGRVLEYDTTENLLKLTSSNNLEELYLRGD